ncbi:MAG: hypothetical protein ACI4AO_09545 [Anaerotignum sp.]
MTARELLTTIDQMRPNAFTDGEKLHFLNTIEGRIYTEILNRAEGNDLTFIPFQEGEEEKELIVQIPYTYIYIYYLAAMIDFYNGDSDRYNDTMVLFNQEWEDYAAYYRQTHKPKQTNLTGMLPHRYRG